jgi:hypothetical protein
VEKSGAALRFDKRDQKDCCSAGTTEDEPQQWPCWKAPGSSSHAISWKPGIVFIKKQGYLRQLTNAVNAAFSNSPAHRSHRSFVDPPPAAVASSNMLGFVPQRRTLWNDCEAK